MKRRAVLADTGPLYAAVDTDDAYHKRAQQELQRLARDRYEILVTYPTLLEAYSLVLFRMGKRAASHWANEISAAVLVHPSTDDYRRAVNKVQLLAAQPITLFDATVAALASRLELQVWTYDHHFDVLRVPVWR